MSRVPIRDGQFRTVGYVETDSHGRQRGLNARFQTVGHFDPARNETRDATYKVVGRGNVLAALIWGR
ncbi:MAG TPA: hypothetical protein VNW53_12970 [Phenylobacterium sp.]|jgi:hypothetical protein|uniref:hypothetical protein n=1 Tax=Phenylobacterium sp. TaxID=1871053 RepID=UPI002B78AE80|nr:hypothetical protein [Phenylobacterium sp.]HXA39906.1 hypothetical protein [Phenylobacterium sp.]